MNIEPLTRSDFLAIIDDHGDFWESDLTYQLHHPLFLEEFGDTAYVIRENDLIVAYLFGLISQTSPTAYIHIVAVREGQKIARGDVLLSLEAMKMETAVRAERDGTIAQILVSAGAQVDAHDLLVVLGE